MSCVIFFLLASSAQAATLIRSKAVETREHISPPLEPVAPSKFNKDYPLDKRAIADKHYVFDHPYPAVQDSSDFDKDFVKDENSDGGRWDAQMRYDTLRAKIGPEQAKLEALKKKMDKEYADWIRAKKIAAEKEKALREAWEAVEKARKLAEAAAKKVNELEGRSQPDGTKTGGAIGRAIEDVKKEMDDLEKCKEALQKAKERLKKLMEEQEKEAKQLEKASKAKETKKPEAKKAPKEEKKPKAKEEEVEKVEKDKKKKVKEAAKEEDDGKKQEEEAHKEVEKDEKKTSEWRKRYLKELEDVKRTEKELEAAAKTLKKFRRPPYVDDNGGVYNVPDSFAFGPRFSVTTVLVALAMAFAPRV